MTAPNDDLVELYRTNGLTEAQAIRLLLEDEGIRVWIDNEMLQMALGELPVGWDTAPRLMVPREDLPTAQVILEDFFQQRKANQADNALEGLCLNCRHLMGEATVCSACGWSFLQEGAPAEAVSPTAVETTVVTPITAVTIEIPQPVPYSVWFEVFVVLSVSVFSNLFNAISLYLLPVEVTSAALPYWYQSLQLIELSIPAIVVTAFVIDRSGLPREAFGITPPRITDLLLGLVMFAVAEIVWYMTPRLPTNSDFFAALGGPRTTLDYFLWPMKYVVACGTEELVTRCYLIVRLSQLLKYRGLAVLFAALLFSSYHVYQGPLGLLYSFLFGLSYSVVFLLIRRLWPLLLGHALFDMEVEWLNSMQ
jgi:hypothetical protein